MKPAVKRESKPESPMLLATSLTIKNHADDFESSRGGAYADVEVRFGHSEGPLMMCSTQHLRTLSAEVDVVVLPEDVPAVWNITRPVSFPGRFDEFVGRTGPEDQSFFASALDVDLLLDGHLVPYVCGGISILPNRPVLAAVRLAEPREGSIDPDVLRRHCVDADVDAETMARIRVLLSRRGPFMKTDPAASSSRLVEELEAIVQALLSQHGSTAVQLPRGTVRDAERFQARHPGLTIYQVS